MKKTFKAEFYVRYKGTETITKTIQAETKEDADRYFEELELGDYLDFWNVNIECLSTNIKEIEYRCEQTEDMFK